MSFHDTSVSVISVKPIKTLRPSLNRFVQTLQTDDRNFVHIWYTRFNTNWARNLDNVRKILFIPVCKVRLSMQLVPAGQVFVQEVHRPTDL
jgi:hypothetical protein